MKLLPTKPYRLLSPDERADYQARCRLAAESPLAFLLFSYGLTKVFRTMIDGPFAIVSGQPASDAMLPEHEMWRRDRTRTTLLRTRIKDGGGAYMPAACVWRLDPGEVLTPDAVFVPAMSVEAAIEFGRAFDQGEVIWSSGPEYWRIMPITGNQAGPFPTGPRLRRFALERRLEEQVEEIERCALARRPRVCSGRRRFFFWRAGGGYITCYMAPHGVSVHDLSPGPRLHADYDDGLMDMGHVDAYLPLP